MAERALKYLAAVVDQKLTFWIRPCNAVDKADTLVAMLLELSIAHLIMLYGAEVWAHVLKTDEHRNKLELVLKKGALKVDCAYCTVFGVVIMVLVRIILIDLLVNKRKRIYDVNQQGEVKGVEKRERTHTLSV